MANKKFSLGIVLSAVDKVSAPLRGIQQKFKMLGDSVENQKSKLSLTASALGFPALKKSFGGFQDSFKGVTDKVKDVAAVLAGVGVVGVGAFLAIKSSAQKLDDLGDFSKTVGINVKAIQEWRYAAANGGSSAEDLDEGIRTFTLSMGKARAGGGKLLGFLNKINPAFSKQLLSVKSNEQGFELMMNAISKVQDPQKRLALSTMAFGSAGESLARVSGEGADKIKKLREEAKKLGLATQEDTDKAGDFNDNMSKMTFALEAAKNAVAVKLMPIMAEFFTKVTKWVSENQVKIQAFGNYLAVNLPIAIEKLIAFFSGLANSPIVGFLVWIVEKVGALNLVLSYLVLYIGGSLIPALFKLGTSFFSVGMTITRVILGSVFMAFKALFALVMAFPITALLVGLVAVGIAVYKNWDDVCEIFKTLWGWIQKILGAGWDKIKSAFSGIGDFFSGDSGSKTQTTSRGVVGAEALGAQQLGQRYFDNKSQTSESAVKVSFDNLPKGARVQTEKSSNSNLDLSMGYSMVGP